jgi:hypothetical protein
MKTPANAIQIRVLVWSVLMTVTATSDVLTGVVLRLAVAPNASMTLKKTAMTLMLLKMKESHTAQMATPKCGLAGRLRISLAQRVSAWVAPLTLM